MKKESKQTKSTADGAEKEKHSSDSGKLGKIAASILMGALYSARMGRFDLLRAICRLACFVSKWDFYSSQT